MASPDIRFYVDADLMAVGMAMARLRKDVTYPGHADADGITQETKDTVWLPRVGVNGWVVITKDRHIRRRPAEVAAVFQNDVRMVVITGNKNMNSWDRFRLIARSWEAIEEMTAVPGPWIMGLTQAGLRELCPPWPPGV